ncbi:ribosomal protein S18-alanine N-acetyltransferase [Paramaledivibacter caminithermalis]|jgi:ribosomal-protein-alanine N-acetyltransferase|uniref:[Ribosomal protein bS18]-alanine N-acetyltransferase n=1 Tax=Paramaledivibacter caminithermalis (strain DSM 15212 / CIP 107654 / DViRD3) TaxID=1121301 RepID=A0A1M6L8H7_PARC5|nr:ribosomal protein S18-alanine N-acetyltransferase [Paramaledivibacter caminithermalis]SHJ67486.1 [SSU ribosomal protein S18P]-alanine acetyltransferase [Paramaledivibacter caminithermalis DSM 15212]
MSNITVREMTLDDIDSVIEIENSSFLTPWTRESFEKEIRNNQLAKYLVIEYENQIVGYGGMWIIIDEAHITNIAIHKDFRNKKLGSFLVESMIEYAESLRIYRMTLEVRESNIAAQGLYMKLGFKPCGKRPKYYHDNNEDAIIMWRG